MSDLRWVGAVAFMLDTVVILEWVWVAAAKPSDPAWVMAYLLPIEGAMRYGILGAFAPLPVLLISEIAREMYLAEEFPSYHFVGPAVAFRVGMAAVIALVAGVFASSLRKEAEHATDRTIAAEEAALRAEEAAKREAEARRDLSAFHTAILAGVASEDPAQGIQEIAEAVGREMECDSLGVLLLETGEGGSEELVAAGVYGDPGYRRNTRFIAGSEPFASGTELARPSLRQDPAEAVVPLRAGDAVIGILHERGNEPGSIDRERLLQLGRLADQVSLVVQAARLRARQEEMLVRLRELDELKSDFVAITSHELRTPLTAVRGFVDALRRRHAELSVEEVQEYLMIIHSQTDRLIRLVEDLLLISRIEAGKLTFMPHPVNTHVPAGRGVSGSGRARRTRRDEPGPRRTAGPRRRRPTIDPGPHEPVDERDQVLPVGCEGRAPDGFPLRGDGHVRGAGPRTGRDAGRARSDLRSLPSDGVVGGPLGGRRARPLHREAADGGDGGLDRPGIGAGRGSHVHRHDTDGPGPRSTRSTERSRASGLNGFVM